MWKEYSRSYIKNNRSSGISVMVAAFISALFLSLLCSLFYNLWKYEVERIQIDRYIWRDKTNAGALGCEKLYRIPESGSKTVDHRGRNKRALLWRWLIILAGKKFCGISWLIFCGTIPWTEPAECSHDPCQGSLSNPVSPGKTAGVFSCYPPKKRWIWQNTPIWSIIKQWRASLLLSK